MLLGQRRNLSLQGTSFRTTAARSHVFSIRFLVSAIIAPSAALLCALHAQLVLILQSPAGVQSFVVPAPPTKVQLSAPPRPFHPPQFFRPNRSHLHHHAENDDPEDDDQHPDNINTLSSTILSRFTSPTIDDPYLPLSDVLVAQIIAPSLQVGWLSIQHSPAPTWLRPVFAPSTLYTPQGIYVAPTLIHGAALATLWLAGALAARTYEQAAMVPTLTMAAPEDDPQPNGTTPHTEKYDYRTVLSRVLQAGAFATGLLIFSTQMDLLWEYKGRWIQPGESPETDFRILTAAIEIINDVFFEAVCLITWRLYLAFQSRPVE